MISVKDFTKRIACYMDQDDVDYENAQLELTVTSKHHNWHNTVADRMFHAVHKNTERGVKEFNNDEVIIFPRSTLEEFNVQIQYYNRNGNRSRFHQEMLAGDADHCLLND